MLCTFFYCDFFVFAVDSLLMISIFNYRFYECNNCTLCYMYLQVIRINIIVIIINKTLSMVAWNSFNLRFLDKMDFHIFVSLLRAFQAIAFLTLIDVLLSAPNP